MTDNKVIKIMNDGPYMVYGRIPLSELSIKIDAMGKSTDWIKTGEYTVGDIYALCRCGKSKNMPFCDASHMENGFDGTETAGNAPYAETCKRTKGCDKIELLEKPILCTGAGFCHAGKTIERAIKKEKTLDIAKKFCDDCPGGSLTLVIDGEVYEPELPKEIHVTNDVRTIGPIWVKGGIPIISANGEQYEIRNRVALCRCGRSKNMPFCDSSHLDRS
ncbi:MAG: CDGSH iron-sulfur domain-containing protein [Candidatus Methanomethylophilaceae archaeon]|jgi:CDGSH-type Zn-finger protein